MKLAVVADEQLKQAFLSKQVPAAISICFVKHVRDIPADAYIVFDLLFEDKEERIFVLQQFLPRLVFINAVCYTLGSMDKPFIRINAWPGFLENSVAEISGRPEQQNSAAQAMQLLGWRYRWVADLPGMVSARIISMVINEAYFALDEKISTREAIDIAMQYGTNYPYGPFEWSKRIGLKKIYGLLLQMGHENELYKISTLLKQEALDSVIKET